MRKRLVVLPLVTLLVLLSAGVGIFGTAWAKSPHSAAGTAHAPRVSNPPPGQLPTLLTPSAASGAGCFGCAIAVDGNTLVVGADSTGHFEDTGAAFIFARSGLANTWTQQAELTPSVTDIEFGQDVAIGENTVVIGAPGSQLTNAFTGAAYVYVRSGTTWTQQAELTGSGPSELTGFGTTVAISADGNTLVAGAGGHGAVYVYVRSGTTWSLQKELVPTGEPADADFGYNVTLSANGNTILGGAIGANASYVYVRSGTTWSDQKELIPSDGAKGELFGAAQALSANGNTALIGAYLHNDHSLDINGAAYVYVRSGTTWSQQKELVASDPLPVSDFSFYLALTADGNTAVVSGETPDVSTHAAVWFFVRSGTTWSQNAKLLPPAGSTAIDGPLALGAVGSPLVADILNSEGAITAVCIFLRNEKL